MAFNVYFQKYKIYYSEYQADINSLYKTSSKHRGCKDL